MGAQMSRKQDGQDSSNENEKKPSDNQLYLEKNGNKSYQNQNNAQKKQLLNFQYEIPNGMF